MQNTAYSNIDVKQFSGSVSPQHIKTSVRSNLNNLIYSQLLSRNHLYISAESYYSMSRIVLLDTAASYSQCQTIKQKNAGQLHYGDCPALYLYSVRTDITYWLPSDHHPAQTGLFLNS